MPRGGSSSYLITTKEGFCFVHSLCSLSVIMLQKGAPAITVPQPDCAMQVLLSRAQETQVSLLSLLFPLSFPLLLMRALISFRSCSPFFHCFSVFSRNDCDIFFCRVYFLIFTFSVGFSPNRSFSSGSELLSLFSTSFFRQI